MIGTMACGNLRQKMVELASVQGLSRAFERLDAAGFDPQTKRGRCVLFGQGAPNEDWRAFSDRLWKGLQKLGPWMGTEHVGMKLVGDAFVGEFDVMRGMDIRIGP